MESDEKRRCWATVTECAKDGTVALGAVVVARRWGRTEGTGSGPRARLPASEGGDRGVMGGSPSARHSGAPVQGAWTGGHGYVRIDIVTADARPLVWLHGEVRTPPFSTAARLEAGYLLRLLQQGEVIGMPHSRPMPSIGRGCHELRIRDADHAWRIVYRIDSDAIVIAEVFSKKQQRTPSDVVSTCRDRLRRYDEAAK